MSGWVLGLALTAALAAGAAVWFAAPDLRAELAAGTALGLALVAPGALGLWWALRRSDAAFYSVFAAGALARLVMFAAAGLAVHRFTALSLPATLLTGIGAFFVFSLVEMYLLQREASAPWNFSKS